MRLRRRRAVDAQTSAECDHEYTLPWRPSGWTQDEIHFLARCHKCGVPRIPRGWDDDQAHSDTDPRRQSR
jgi:hypothetical protein